MELSAPAGSGMEQASSDALTLVRQKGLEPPAYCLEGSCSIRLSYWRIFKAACASVLERVKGIEPSYPAWKAGVLPLNYTRKPGNFTILRGACQELFPRRNAILPVEQLFDLVFRLAGDVDAQL